jgi:hypothetical protein
MGYISTKRLGLLVKRLSIIHDASVLSCSSEEGCRSDTEHLRAVAKRHTASPSTVRRLRRLMETKGLEGIVALR